MVLCHPWEWMRLPCIFNIPNRVPDGKEGSLKGKTEWEKAERIIGLLGLVKIKGRYREGS